MSVSDKRAMNAAQTLYDYCLQQVGCYHCIFNNTFESDMDCPVSADIDFERVRSNYNAKLLAGDQT